MFPKMIALIIVVLAFGYLPAYLAEVSLLECMYKYQENLDYRYRACMIHFIAPPNTKDIYFAVYHLWKVKVKRESVICSVVSHPLRLHGLQSARLVYVWNSPGKNTGMGSHSLLQGIFLTYELNLGLPHCGQILYCVSHWKANSISQAKKPYQLLLKAKENNSRFPCRSLELSLIGIEFRNQSFNLQKYLIF